MQVLTSNPFALRKAKIVYNFGLSECHRVKRKTIVLSKDIKIILFAIFSYFFKLSKVGISILKKKFSKKVSYLPTLSEPHIFFIWPNGSLASTSICLNRFINPSADEN